MMKKWLALLLALLLLTGCAGTGSGETPPGEEPPVSQEPEEAPLPQWKVDTQLQEGLYDLSSLPALEGLTVISAGLISPTEVLLLTGITGDTLQLLDLETGELSTLCTLELETEVDQNWASTYLLSYDPIVVQDYSADVCRVIDRDGTLRAQLTGSYHYFGRDRALRCDGAGILYAVDYATGMEEVLGTIPTSYLYAGVTGASLDGKSLILEAMSAAGEQPVTLLVSTGMGEITASYEGWNHTYLLSGQVEIRTVNEGEGEVYPDMEYPEPSTRFTLTARRGSSVVTRALDLDDLSATGQADPYSDWIGTAADGAQSFWGVTLLNLWMEEECRLVLWDFSGEETVAGEAALLKSFTPPVYDMGEMGQRAAEMSEKYGVEIYVGQSVVDAPFWDYTLEPCEDPYAISDGLDVLEEAFSLYPEGYLAQLGGEEVRQICFYLTGTMTPVDPTMSIENPAGLAAQTSGMELIALNTSGFLCAQDVVHELTHVLDHWLWAEGVLEEEDWSAMNPEDFSYYYAYVDENGESYEFSGSETYTSWDAPAYEGQVDTIYFVDPYATTYPTEDRARLMEHLLADQEGYVPGMYESVHLQEKMSYYFQCIRQVFDTAGWPEQTEWELRLAQAANE